MIALRRLAVLFLFLAGLSLAGCSNDVTIGAVISESGAVETYGTKVRKGMDLALEEINAAGGFQGGSFSLIYKDDATNPDRGRQVTVELIDNDNARIIIGAVSSPVTLAIAPICESNRVVLLSPSSSAAKISEAGDYIYRNYPSDIIEGTAMAKFAKEEIGAERVVIFALASDWGRGLAEVFTKQYPGRFRKVVKTFEFDETTLDQLPGMVAELGELKPDAVYLVAYDRELVELLQVLHDAGVDAVRMGTSSATEEVGRHAGEAAENLVYPTVVFDVDSTEPAVASFVEAYRAKYDEDPDLYSAHGYDALKLILEGMKNGGSSHPNDVRIGLGSISNYEGAAGRTSFDEMGDVVRYPRIFIMRDGVPLHYDELKNEGGSVFD